VSSKATALTTEGIGLLKAAPNNWRRIDSAAAAGLGVSMETFGDLSGIVFNKRSGNLVAGHQRVTELRAAGAKDWTRESKTAGWIVHPKTKERFPIRIVDWDEPTEIMANIAANNPALQGEFTEGLEAELRGLEAEANFEELRLRELMAGEPDEPRDRRTLDEFDVTPSPKKTWILIATTEALAAEIEIELREKYESEDTRIEVSVGAS
jgi:hypothetical protein